VQAVSSFGHYSCISIMRVKWVQKLSLVLLSWGWNCYCKDEKVQITGSDQILAELIQARGGIWLSAIHKLVNSVWNKEELSDQWKESIIVPVHQKGDKTDCNNYRGIPLLSTSNKILSNILFSRSGPYIDKIIGDHQHRFWRNRSTTDQIFCIHQTVEKKW
jgi:hypothetical protein